MPDFNAAMLNPGAHFKTPADVLVENRWSQEQKYRVLRQWKYDLGQLQVATEENMPGLPNPPVNMAAVNAALETLGYQPDFDPEVTKGS